MRRAVQQRRPRSRVVHQGNYVLLSELQQRCLQGGHHASKSELVRAGLKALIQMKSDELLRTAQAVEKLKPGRVRGRH